MTPIDHLPYSLRFEFGCVSHSLHDSLSSSVSTLTGVYKTGGSPTHFLTKTLARVSTEMSLHALAFNLKRMLRIFGVQPLITAMTG
jgi:hypothetical protein